MLKMRVETPRLDPLVAALVFQLHNKKAFVKNWANSVAIEARGNARKKGGRRYWQELARSIRVKSISATEAEISSDYKGAGATAATEFTTKPSPKICVYPTKRRQAENELRVKSEE